MAYSLVVYTGNGVTRQFAVTFPFLARSHVAVAVNGVNTTAFTWLSDSLIQMNVAPVNLATVRISRSSSRDTRITDFQDAQSLTEAALDFDARQNFYVAQEAFDGWSSSAGAGDMLRSNNLSDVFNTAAALSNLGGVKKAGDTMAGPLYLSGYPAQPAEAASKGYVDGLVASISLPALTLTGAAITAALGYVPVNKAGDTMGGALSLAADPTAAMHAATKQYVDAFVGAGTGTGEWVFRTPVSNATPSALLVRSFAPTAAAAGAMAVNSTRNGGLPVANMALGYTISATTTANSDIGLQSIIVNQNMAGGGNIAGNFIAAGPRTDTGARRLVGLDVRVAERAVDVGLQRDRTASNKISLAAQFGPDNSTTFGDGAASGFNASFGIVLQASNNKATKSWVPFFIEQDATAASGLSMLLRGGSTVPLAPAALMEVRDNFVVGFDTRNATFNDADHTAIWLGLGQCMHFSPGSRMYADPSENLTFFDPIAGSVTLNALKTAAASGTNILPLANAFTGSNTFSKAATLAVPSVQINALQNGPIVDGGILVSQMRTALDVRKSTDAAVETSSTHGIYVQHNLTGNTAVAMANCAIRAQMQTAQTKSAGTFVNDAVGVYSSIFTTGADVGGFGVHVDATHQASGSSTMYGASIEMYRKVATGLTIGVHARAIGGGGLLNNDFGFLCSQGGDPNVGFTSAFAAGTPATGGFLKCAYGLDLRYATSDNAAIAIQSDKKISFDSGGNVIAQRFNSGTGRMEFLNTTARFGVNLTQGVIYAWDGVNGAYGNYHLDPAGTQDSIMAVRSGARTDAPANPTTVANWLAIRVDGTRYHLALYF